MIRIQHISQGHPQRYVVDFPPQKHQIRIGFSVNHYCLYCLWGPGQPIVFKILTNRRILLDND